MRHESGSFQPASPVATGCILGFRCHAVPVVAPWMREPALGNWGPALNAEGGDCCQLLDVKPPDVGGKPGLPADLSGRGWVASVAGPVLL